MSIYHLVSRIKRVLSRAHTVTSRKRRGDFGGYLLLTESEEVNKSQKVIIISGSSFRFCIPADGGGGGGFRGTETFAEKFKCLLVSSYPPMS